MPDKVKTDTGRPDGLNEKIQAVLVEALQVAPEIISPGPGELYPLAFGDLPQWDSMGHMEVMIGLEQVFGIEINAETIADLTSVQFIRQYIEENGYA